MIKQICSKCKEELPLTSFHKEKKGKNGVRKECKQCVRSRNKTYDNKEKYRVWFERNAITGTVVYWNTRASKPNERTKHMGIGVVTGKELKSLFESSNNLCAYCGDAIDHTTCEVEHINPISRGGSNTVENITFSCKVCNSFKFDSTPDEMIQKAILKIEHLNKIINYSERQYRAKVAK